MAMCVDIACAQVRPVFAAAVDEQLYDWNHLMTYVYSNNKFCELHSAVYETVGLTEAEWLSVWRLHGGAQWTSAHGDLMSRKAALLLIEQLPDYVPQVTRTALRKLIKKLFRRKKVT